MKVGVLGYGRAGRRHAANATALGHEVWTYDPVVNDETSYPGPREQMIIAADAIVIATPAERHLNDLLNVLAADKPVLVEKPIGLTRQYDAIKEVLDLNAQATAPTPVYCGYNLRFHAQIRKIKQALAEADDNPYYANFVCCQYTDQQAPLINGVCNDWLPHEVDLAQYLLGPLRLIDHHADRFRAELRLVQWDTGCQVHIHSDMMAKEHVRCGVIATPDVSMRYDLEADPVTEIDYKAELAAFTLLIEGWGVKLGTEDVLATGQEALSVLKICKKADL